MCCAGTPASPLRSLATPRARRFSTGGLPLSLAASMKDAAPSAYELRRAVLAAALAAAARGSSASLARSAASSSARTRAKTSGSNSRTPARRRSSELAHGCGASWPKAVAAHRSYRTPSPRPGR
jgi:hypothetical protein